MTNSNNDLKDFICEYAGDCPGAFDPVLKLLELGERGLAELFILKDLGIKGTDLYTLWSDCSKKDIVKFMLSIRALESGVYNKTEIDRNFMINRTRALNEDSIYYKELDNFLMSLPFIYDKIDPDKYITDYSIVYDQPQHPELKKYFEANRIYFRLLTFFQSMSCKLKDIEVLDDKYIKFKSSDYKIDEEKYLGYALKKFYYFYGKRYSQSTDNKDLKEVTISVKQLDEVMGENSYKKFYNEKTLDDYFKIFEWLKVSKNSFLPSFVVVKNMPIENIKNFYINGNDTRYAKLIKLSGYKEFLEQEGLFKIAYLLGLFEPSSIVSEKAYNFICSEMLEKDIPNDQLHKLYGGIYFYNGFVKEFADFFMINYKEDPRCFENENGVDHTGFIYYKLKDILKFRSEKEIKTKTNRNRLTPKDVLSYLSNIAFQFDISPMYLEFIEQVSKYFYISNKEDANLLCDLYKNAQQVEGSKVSIPIITGIVDNIKYRVLNKTDIEAFVVGNKTNCCFHLSGAAQSSYIDSLTSLNSRVVVFENDSAYVQGWIWYDKDNKFLCIDNLEGVIKKHVESADKTAQNIIESVIVFANKIRDAIINKGLPCEKVNLGLLFIKELFFNKLESLKKKGIIKDEPKPKMDYCRNNSIYTDACVQVIIADDSLKSKQKDILNKYIEPSQPNY